MEASKDSGIEISKAELGALLFFAGGPTKDGVVTFRVNAQQKLVACAGDGKKSVMGIGKAGDHMRGEWAVPATFLETLRRGINKGKTEAVLEVNGKGLKHARLRGAASKGKQVAIEDETNGTSTQLSIDEIAEELDEGSELTGGWFAVKPKDLARATDVVSKAAEGCPVTIYPPNLPLKPVCFEASCEGGRWRGKITPATVTAPGDEADEDEDEPPPGTETAEASDLPTQKRKKKQPALPGTEGKPAKKARKKS